MRVLYVKELRLLGKTHDAQGDLCNISKVNETCNLIIATYDNRLEKTN